MLTQIAIAEDERKEVLIKAQQDEIHRYKAELQRTQREFEACQHEMNALRIETAQFRAEFNAHNSFHGGQPATASHAQPPPQNTGVNGYGSGHYERPRTQPDAHQGYTQRVTELPPLRGINGSVAPEAMSGVQYQQHDPRSNGYRTAVEQRF